MNNTENPEFESNLAGNPKKGFDIFYFVLKRTIPVSIVGLLLFILLLPFALILSKTYYESEGFLQIARVVSSVSGETDPMSISNYFDDYASTQARIIQSYDTLKAALLELPENEWPTFLDPALPIETNITILQRNFLVAHVDGTHLIRLSMESLEPEGIAEMINQIMEVYINKQRDDQEQLNSRRFAYLLGKQKELAEALIEREKKLYQLVKETGSSSFSEQFNMYYDRLSSLEESYAMISAARFNAEADYRSAIEIVTAVEKLSPDAAADEMVARDESIWSIQFWTYQMMQDMRASIHGIAKENPDRKFVEERMESMQNYLKNHLENVTARDRKIIREQRDYDLKKMLIESEAKYKAAVSAEETMHASLEEVRAQTRDTSGKMREGTRMEAEVKDLRERIVPLESKIQDLYADSKAPARISIESKARAPYFPARTSFRKILAVCFVFAFGIVGFPVFVYDVMDDRIRRSVELNRALGRIAPDPIVEYDLRSSEKPYVRATLDIPNHPTVSSLRRLAIRLDKERKVHGSKCAIFTGLERGSGVTETIINVAHAMTNFCPRVLLIEADNLHPSIGRLLNLNPPDYYLENYIRGEVGWEDCILFDPERKIDVAVFRKITWNNAQYRELAHMIASAKGVYDFIFIDSGTILERPSTQYLALQADITVLVIHEDVTLYSDLRQTMELIYNSEIPAMTAVLNFSKPLVSRIVMKNIQSQVLKISKAYRKHSKTLVQSFLEKEQVAAVRKKIGKLTNKYKKWVG